MMSAKTPRREEKYKSWKRLKSRFSQRRRGAEL
jgi:hypothetical protein